MGFMAARMQCARAGGGAANGGCGFACASPRSRWRGRCEARRGVRSGSAHHAARAGCPPPSSAPSSLRRPSRPSLSRRAAVRREPRMLRRCTGCSRRQSRAGRRSRPDPRDHYLSGLAASLRLQQLELLRVLRIGPAQQRDVPDASRRPSWDQTRPLHLINPWLAIGACASHSSHSSCGAPPWKSTERSRFGATCVSGQGRCGSKPAFHIMRSIHISHAWRAWPPVRSDRSRQGRRVPTAARTADAAMRIERGGEAERSFWSSRWPGTRERPRPGSAGRGRVGQESAAVSG
jgi:hypothetical protein